MSPLDGVTRGGPPPSDATVVAAAAAVIILILVSNIISSRSTQSATWSDWPTIHADISGRCYTRTSLGFFLEMTCGKPNKSRQFSPDLYSSMRILLYYRTSHHLMVSEMISWLRAEWDVRGIFYSY